MEISLTQQVITFGASVVLGAVLGVVYELFRTVRSLFGGRTVAVFLQDVLFWIVSAFVVYTFFLIFTGGTVRYFVLAGAAVGLIIYLKTVGRLTAYLFSKMFMPVRYAARKIATGIKWLFSKIFSRKTGKKRKIISENT